MKRTPLARVSTRTAKRMAEPGHDAFTAPTWGRCQVCGRPGLLRRHHVVLEQHVRSLHGDPWDLRNGMLVGDRSVCDCHAAHHQGGRRIPVSKVPIEAVVFCSELYGEQTGAYLSRYYAPG